MAKLRPLHKMPLDYAHEPGAMVPLSDAARSLEQLDREIKEAERRTSRVVNAWFADGNRAVTKKETLSADSPYSLKFQIGPASTKSIVKDAGPIDEQFLSRFYSAQGLELRVVLFSSDFSLEESEKPVLLPKPPEETEELEFKLRTPSKPGTATVRVCVYFRRNLLQALLIKAKVTELAEKRRSKCIEAKVDFSTTGSFADLEELPEQTVSFATNQQGSTHSFYVHGDGLYGSIDLRHLSDAVDDTRREMEKVCAGPVRKKPKYQFDRHNRGTEAKLIKQVQGLAEMGYALYARFVTGQDKEFEKKLREALGKSATIQVAVTQNTSYVFPWAMVYDKPLVGGDNSVCSQFLKDLRDRVSLDTQVCLVNGCAQKSKSVICPSAFWGFRHVIEQPLSIHEASPGPATNVVSKIKASTPVTCLVGVSEELKHVDEHEKELQALGGLVIDVQRSKADIGLGLQRQDVPLIYFYCHGGRHSTRVWLGIGKKERLSPPDLHAWGVEWPIVHPLVFINGCETAAITPDDLLPFNRILARGEAAGVIGTEISIPEVFGRHCGKEFLRDFVDGASVGTAIRALRLRLLQGYNPLGLIYTPYCSATLSLD
jgi:hypothetical protein